MTLTPMQIASEVLGRKPSGRNDWMEDLEGGMNHPGTAANEDTPTDLDERIAKLRARVAESGLIRR